MRDPQDFGPWLRALMARQATDAAEVAPAAECPDPSRIWDAVHGGQSEDEVGALLEHSLRCPACAAAWQLARELSPQVGQAEPRVQRATQVRELPVGRARPAWGWAAALAAGLVVVVAGAVLWRGLGPGAGEAGPVQAAARWVDLEVPVLELPRVAAGGGMVFRGGAAGGELGAALEAYEKADFELAADGLGRWAAEHPEDVQARLLLGVALLKLGDVDGAVIPLEDVASLGAAETAPDASYYLALAYLKRGEEGKARAQLLVIEASGGRWKAEAEQLLPKLGEAGGGAR